MKIEINDAKTIADKNNLTHIIIFGINENGEQFITTYGTTKINAKQAASSGNKLKRTLHWPEQLCKAEPIERICKNCDFYQPQNGVFCANGWSGNINKGQCFAHETKTIRNADDRACIYMEFKE